MTVAAGPIKPHPCFPAGGLRVVRHRSATPGEFGLRDFQPVRVWWFRSRGTGQHQPIWSANWVPGRAIRAFYNPPPWTAPEVVGRVMRTMRKSPLRYVR